MDKNTYETYEYLPSNTTEAESDQFFVVQDDGTFLLNRQVQYVAQVQDVKEVLEEVQPCTVYGVGVASQQFYVDNSTDLISVSDQFILPHGDSSLYTNSYLLQSNSSNATEQIENIVDEQFEQTKTQESDLEDTTSNCKQENNFTEITLSDDQYQTLEQKGWILLEANNKIFVLNTLGLHDITANDKLIQKLRNEIENDTKDGAESGNIKIENVKQELPNLVGQSFNNQQDTVELIIGSNEEQDDSIENLQFIISDKENAAELSTLDSEEQMETCESNEELKPIINEIATVKQELLKSKSSIMIKTKYNFKDIPEKIVLGKSVNGKRLVAKVVKIVTNEEKQNAVEKSVDQDVPDSNQDNHNNGISESELLNLISISMRSGSQKKMKPEDVKSTENVIAPLLKVPNLKNSLVGHDLLITKVRNNKDEYGEIFSRGKVTLLTGHVKEKDDSTAVFEFLPDLLQTIKTNSEDSVTDENQHIESIDNENEICTIFHVHITETKGADKVVRVSVALNKRQLSISQMFDLKKRQPSKVFACSACATLYKSEAALKDHQENDCLDADETLTVDTNKIDMVDAYSIIKEDKDKCFSCTQCNAKFPKLYTCVRHVKTHFGLHPTKADIEKEKEASKEPVEAKRQKTNKEVYKCKMCSSTYFHPATLSKHIMTRHIKVKSK